MQAVVAAAGFTDADVLIHAASLERMSEHPLAQSIVRFAQEQRVALLAVENFESTTGKGVRGQIDGKVVSLGNAKTDGAGGR